MHINTRNQVEQSFLTSSRNSARKKLYALRAEQDGNTQQAKLFRAMAASEDAQATRFLLQLRGQIGSNSQNIATIFSQELPELVEHYTQAARIAANTKDVAMESAFTQSAKVARIHQSLMKKLANNPIKNNSYQVCSFCGFIMEDHAPEQCPICTAPAKRFKEI